MKTHSIWLGLALILTTTLFCSFILDTGKQKPTLYLIGDSTVKNGKDKGDGSQWGWGHYVSDYFDTTRIEIKNEALGGTSSRTFKTKALWDSVLTKVKPGDFVMMQFGHNDGSPLDDTARARGTIKGIGTESQEIYNPITKKKEVVFTYGWYLRKFINDIKAKKATAIVCSPIPRNPVKDGQFEFQTDLYADWAAGVAKAEGVYFVNLNKLVKDGYTKLPAEQVDGFFTKKDHTHTSKEGAVYNAKAVVSGLKSIKKCPLNKFLLP